MTDWSKPIPVSDVMLAFPAIVTGKLLPPVEDIPKEFINGNRWTELVNRHFAGLPVTASLSCKDGVDYTAALRQVSACMASFEPKHEHKIAGVAYLMSLFFGLHE